MRVTWIQPEDVIGHELRQAREEGKEIDDVEARWLAAGGSHAPARGASPDAAAPELQALAGELLDEVASRPRPLAELEPDAFEAIAGDLPSAAPAADLATRIEGAWRGRVVGCVLGKPVENIPREGIRALLEAADRWPLDRWITARGVPDEVSERWPWNRASQQTSLEENIDGAAEDDDLNFTMLATAILERTHDPSELDVAKAWLDFLPPGRIFTAERIAMRNLLLGLLPPETATYRNPFREWIGARLRVDAYGWAAPGEPGRAALLAWRDARVSHTANGVYAAMWMAAAHAWSLVDTSAAAAADAAATVVPPRSRLAAALSLARQAAARPTPWETVVDELYDRLGSYHWVHAINNTALVAAALYRFDGDFDGAICGVVQAGWDTDTNGAAVGSILGATLGPQAISARWTDPLHDRVASSLPGFDRSSIVSLAARTQALAS